MKSYLDKINDEVYELLRLCQTITNNYDDTNIDINKRHNFNYQSLETVFGYDNYQIIINYLGIIKYQDGDLFASSYYSEEINGLQKPLSLTLYNNKSIYSFPIIAHEISHLLTDVTNINVPPYMDEILPMFYEKVISKQLDCYSSFEKLRIKSLKNYAKDLLYLVKIKDELMSPVIEMTVEKQINESVKYIYGYLESEKLFNQYQKDPTLLAKINRIFNGNTSLELFLNQDFNTQHISK